MSTTPKVELKPVKSSAVSECGYDEQNGVIAVRYKSGGLYHFTGASKDDFDGLMSSKSFGKQLHQMKPKLSPFNPDQKK